LVETGQSLLEWSYKRSERGAKTKWLTAQNVSFIASMLHTNKIEWCIHACILLQRSWMQFQPEKEQHGPANVVMTSIC